MTNDASSVVFRFEVRIGEANEDLFHLVLAEEVGQVSHAVGSVKVCCNGITISYWTKIQYFV